MELGSEYFSYKNFISLSDEEKIIVLNWRNHESIRKWMFNQSTINLDDHLKFIKNLSDKKTQKYWLVFRDLVPVGTTSIIDIADKSAEWGYYIAPEYHETAIGIEFYYFTIKYLFDVEQLDMIYGYELRTNKAASALNTLFGFSKQSDIKEVNNIRYEVNYRELRKKMWKESITNKPQIQRLIGFAKSRS